MSQDITISGQLCAEAITYCLTNTQNTPLEIRRRYETNFTRDLPPQLRNLPYLSPVLPSLTFYESPPPSFARFRDTYISSFNFFFFRIYHKNLKRLAQFFQVLIHVHPCHSYQQMIGNRLNA